MSKLGIDLVKKLERAAVFLPSVRKLRLQRLQNELVRHTFAAAVLFDPISIRYATDVRNLSLFHLHFPMRYAIIPAEGKPTVFDYGGTLPSNEFVNLEDSVPISEFMVGPRINEKSEEWAKQMVDFLRPITSGFGCNRVAIERPVSPALFALSKEGFELHHAAGALSAARVIKVPGELELIEASMAVVSEGLLHLKDSLRAGMTENKVWSYLHQKVIEFDGEWIDSRLLLSGKKGNPWFQESGMKIINKGELVGVDTDAVGPFNYCTDFSRTFLCPGPDGEPIKPTDAQRDLYKYAYEQIQYNMALIKPGVGFKEFTQKAWKIPDRFVKNRYPMSVHGIGMLDEYPVIAHPQDVENIGYDGNIEENMTLCVESYIGEEGGKEGVKLEEHVLVMSTGVKVLSNLVPFEEELLKEN